MGMKKDKFAEEDEDIPLEQGTFDELDIPDQFSGTFRELFQYLLTAYGTITLGIYRCACT
jgi:hypothetical protein